jgi:hypothetical protein
MANDMMARTEVTQEQRTRLLADLRRAERAVSMASLCMDPEMFTEGPSGAVAAQAPGCGRPRSAGSRPQAEDVTALRRSFEDSGFPGATVRIARADDPAPRGAIVFGVPLGDACFVGYQNSLHGGGGEQLAGRLPGDRCLSA